VRRRRGETRLLFRYVVLGLRRDVRIRALKKNVSQLCWCERRGERTRYHPVGLPVFPILSWDVRTKRTLGAILMEKICLIVQLGCFFDVEARFEDGREFMEVGCFLLSQGCEASAGHLEKLSISDDITR